MKKDKKFLDELDKALKGVSKKNKERILLKYENIIKEEKSKNKKITVIIKELGNVNDIAKLEKEELKKNSKSNNIKSKMKDLKNNYPKKVKDNKKEEKEQNIKEQKHIKQLSLELDDIKEEVNENIEKTVVNKRKIILKILSVILICLMCILLFWVSILFISSLFAYLDGVKIIGINIGLFGLCLLILWIIIMINNRVFLKKNNVKLNIIVIITSIVIMAFGVSSAIYKIYNLEFVSNVNTKYKMTTKIETYDMPSNKSKNLVVNFNTNYDTEYQINYDTTLKDKIRIELKYYECYYNYYQVVSNNSVYISLKLDNRDRLSVYIDDLKEGKIFDNDELSRYVVTISVNPEDIERLTVNN